MKSDFFSAGVPISVGLALCWDEVAFFCLFFSCFCGCRFTVCCGIRIILYLMEGQMCLYGQGRG